MRKARSASREDRSRSRRLDYQPEAKPPVWIPVPIPISKRMQKEGSVSPDSMPEVPAALPPAPEAEPVPGTDLLAGCGSLQECLLMMAKKYSLDSFTIATSDGLVFASNGGESAQVDAASFSREDAEMDRPGVTLFSLNHGGSELTGIIRARAGISQETRKRIEHDTKDILNRWV